jgi:periplasmic protein TonB
MIASLGIVIGVFAMPLQTNGGNYDILNVPHEVVHLEEIEVTRQVLPPPPLPSPPPPVAVPDDEVIETLVLDLDMELDLSRTVAPPPPPRPPSAPAPAPEPEPAEPEIFMIVEQMPELIGGLESVQRLVRYPEMARRAGIEGVVFVQFIVHEEGHITDAVCVRDPGGGTCEAAIEAVRQARFKPGLQRGRPVKVRYSMPIRFRLTE